MNKTYKVCLDPGHGIETPGKCSPDKSYYEHEFALDMARRMEAILKRHGVEVTLTRTTEKTLTGSATNAESEARVKIANSIPDLNLFVSLHSNAAGDSGWQTFARGLSIYTSAAGDTAARNVAAKAILARHRKAGVMLRPTPLVHNIDIIVLRKTTAPAVLIEHLFHDNKEDVALLKDSAYRDKLAEANCKGILDFLGIQWMEQKTPELTVEEAKAIVKEKAGLSDETIQYIAVDYRFGDKLIIKLAKAMK